MQSELLDHNESVVTEIEVKKLFETIFPTIDGDYRAYQAAEKVLAHVRAPKGIIPTKPEQIADIRRYAQKANELFAAYKKNRDGAVELVGEEYRLPLMQAIKDWEDEMTINEIDPEHSTKIAAISEPSDIATARLHKWEGGLKTKTLEEIEKTIDLLRLELATDKLDNGQELDERQKTEHLHKIRIALGIRKEKAALNDELQSGSLGIQSVL